MKKNFRYFKNKNIRIIFSLVLCCVLGMAIFYIFTLPKQTKANPGWLTGWSYRKPITINNTSNANTLSNYQILVTVDTAALYTAGKVKSDCSDIRFTDSDETTLLNYWIEDGSCNTTATKFWVKIPTITGSTSKTIYMYYGNASATAVSNGSNVFIFFDDFNDGSLDTTNRWIRSTAGAITESSGILDITRNCTDACGYDGVWIRTKDYTLPGNNFRIIRKSYISCSNVANSSVCSYSFPVTGFGNTGDLSFLMYSRDNYSGDQCYYTNRNKVYFCHNAPSGPCTVSLPIWVDKWQREIISEYGPSSTMTYFRDDGVTTESMVDTVTFATTTSNISDNPVGWWYNHTIKLDYVGVGQYASPDPTITVGSEQQPSITLTYRKPITINNTSNASTLTNYQVLVTVDTASLISAGKLQSDCDDIRFTDNSTSYNTGDWTNNYPYWIESGCNTSATKIWVKVDTIPASSNKTIYMYYGNASASSASDIDSTMDAGLRAYYYDGTNFNTYEGTCVDTNINHDWGTGTVTITGCPNDQADTLSIRWEGWVKNQGSGTHTFYVTTDDGSRLYVPNTNLIIDSWKDQIPTEYSGTYSFSSPVTIKYEWYENTGGTNAKLGWAPADGSGKVYPIPSTYLRSRQYTSPEPTTTVGSEQQPSITFSYRKPITINNTSNASTLTNYQVLVTVDTASLVSAGKLQSDCDDIRFTDNSTSYNTGDWTNNYSYWIESGCNTSATKIWVKVDTIPASSNKTIYMYYGNASASSASDIDSTMDAGLRAYYYDGTNFNTYEGTCVDTNINHDWGTGTVTITGCPNDQADTLSIRWEGWVKNQGSGTHTFYVTTDDGSRLYVPNTNLIIDSWKDQIPTEYSGTYSFSSPVTIKYEWYENTGGTNAKLGWAPADGSGKVYPIPSTYLRSRQYTSPEPTTTVGSEQQPSITFSYRKPITINNTSNASTLTNYQVLVTVDTASLVSAGKLQSDCDDIRFTDNSTSYNTGDWTNNYSYWIESGCNTSATKIWVKVDTIPASSNKTIYMYYGNASASGASNGNSTFDFFDDFNDGVIDSNKWQAYDLNGGSGTATETEGVMKLTVTGNGTTPPVLASVPTFTDGILEMKAKVASTNSTPHLMVKFRYDGSSAIEFSLRGGSYDDLYFYEGSLKGEVAAENLDAHLNEWHFIQVKFSGTSVSGYLKNLVTGSSWSTSATVATTAVNPIGLSVWSATTENDFDDVRVRKYTSPEPTTSFNNAPVISSVTDMPDPVNAGIGISFNVNWTDPDPGDLVKIHICKTDAISGQTCTGGSWCDTTAFSNKSPASCVYTPTNDDVGVKNYYAFVCDDDNACSTSTSGTFTVNLPGSPNKIKLSNSTASGTIISAIFDTGVVGGAAFHSLLWQGTLNNGVVKFQLACSNSKTGPWTYYGPTSVADYYQPAGPNIPVPIANTGDASCQNKRYIRYKMFIEPSADNVSPEVDDVIINWSP